MRESEAKIRAELNKIWKEHSYHVRFYKEAPDIDPVKSYNERAENYHFHVNKPTIKIICDSVDDIFITYLGENAKADSTLLDIGTGDGERIKKYRTIDSIADIEAIDISPKMVQIAREKNGINAKVGSFSTIDKKYDVITSLFFVMGILREEEILPTFKKVYESLSEGGIFCFDVMAESNIKEAFDKGYKYSAYFTTIELDGNEELMRPDISKPLSDSNLPTISWSRYFSKEELVGFAEKAGFKVAVAENVDIRNADSSAGQRQYAFILRK